MKARFGVGTFSWAGILRRAVPWLVVGLLGAVEGLYGRTEYLGDWISYLNVSRAASAFQWKGVFDSMWSPGYPLLVALVRGIFPATADGEWYAITLLNWLIFLLAYASWRLLIRRGIELYKPTEGALSHHPFVEFTTGCIFLSCALGLDQVSSVCPDLFVTALFVLAAAQILSLMIRPGAGRAVILGVVLGAGCWMKGVFLAFSMIFLLTVVLACYRKRMPWKMVSIAAATFLLLYLPYAAGLSWSYGKFTVGTTGSLNYEFHVDHLPHWTNWQGTPSPAGEPMHVTTQLAQGLPIFSFGTPFRTTYPPYNNLAYWYEGTHPYYRWNLEMAGVGRSLYFLAVIARANPFLYLIALAWCMVMLKRDWRRSMLANMIRFWPIVLPCYLGVFSYLLVHVEDRYMSPFCMIFGLIPLLPLLDAGLASRRKLAV